MEKDDINVKYQKLALEYSKIRSSVQVLKRAVLEEQQKSSTLRENLRTKEQEHRRVTQELDSVTFRNTQLDKRCEALQEELEREIRKPVKNMKNNKQQPDGTMDVSFLQEELQKLIFENARLASLIADKDSEIGCYIARVAELEQKLTKYTSDHTETERKLRKEIEQMSAKFSELENKLVEPANSICSEDGLSVSGASDTPTHNTITHSTSEERILSLEKEVNHWRAQYEISKMFARNSTNSKSTLVLSNDGRILNRNSSEFSGEEVCSEQILYDNVSRRVEDLLMQKCEAESKVLEFIAECESLKSHLEIMESDAKNKNQQICESRSLLQQTEEDLATTRINYEEQISVLTEQVINLSDQLAASK